MAGKQGVIQPSDLTTGRLRLEIDQEIHKLNIDKIPLLKLLSLLGKKSVGRMKYNWLTKERRTSWGTISAFGGNWAGGAADDGTITVPTAQAYKYSEGDILKCPNDDDINLYVQSVVQSTGVITAITYDNSSTVDFSAGTTGANTLLNISNTFELGSGKGTIKSHQPDENYNYIQIIQTPYGVVETQEHVTYDAGGKELSEQEEEAAIEHEFMKEKANFFGQKLEITTGYMNATYYQYMTGGLIELVSTNVVAETDLTQAEFGSWVNDSIYYAEKPIVFAGATIFEGLSFWLGTTLETRQDETTLGIAVSSYRTQYGDTVKVIPHRELLKNFYAGYAFCVDLADIGYRFLEGEDTHLEMELQQVDFKQVINEFRTWYGFWAGNEKRHGMLSGVTSISA